MQEITKRQRNFLRKLANPLKPTVMLGKQGLTEQIVDKVNRELDAHELIKVRFLEHKDERKQLTATILEETGSSLVILIGHVATLYRQQADPERRQIRLPHGDAQADDAGEDDDDDE
ncbi:YhbY family RNA-binding protein [Oscillochloris sp. ZM17-4]|uniref:YhbY family RNA-binding protein n=1 Tax=Oscillochloris sp. ZM17-4 TaxID=2866714 RepID=UPI001C739EC3|nr:YhbY family RNA-binding protein [Oscillochloris sp. ZM17-4]MBX0326157.1 YhbY family RNA-binding protein [Oscillochloris sp. ZM17-4]